LATSLPLRKKHYSGTKCNITSYQPAFRCCMIMIAFAYRPISALTTLLKRYATVDGKNFAIFPNSWKGMIPNAHRILTLCYTNERHFAATDLIVYRCCTLDTELQLKNLKGDILRTTLGDSAGRAWYQDAYSILIPAVNSMCGANRTAPTRKSTDILLLPPQQPRLDMVSDRQTNPPGITRLFHSALFQINLDAGPSGFKYSSRPPLCLRLPSNTGTVLARQGRRLPANYLISLLSWGAKDSAYSARLLPNAHTGRTTGVQNNALQLPAYGVTVYTGNAAAKQNRPQGGGFFSVLAVKLAPTLVSGG